MREHSLIDASISDFCHAEFRVHFRCFKPPSVVFCYSSHRKLMQGPHIAVLTALRCQLTSSHLKRGQISR